GSCREYKDKGYSGKNTDRPRFKDLIRDIEQGLIQKVVVYKLDRISRSIIDFSNMMELFQRYNVEFVSSTEKFDTSTPMGRAMLNICIVFAQLERETIQKRVTDAYYSRCQKGFHMGGPTPYGFKLEPLVMEGVNTKMMVAEQEAAERVKLMYGMYSDPQTSLGDIVRHFVSEGLDFGDKQLSRFTLSNILRNPIYAQADLDIYEFFKNQGSAIANDVADFAGINGCYLYKGRDAERGGRDDLADNILVVAPHDGLVSSETWLAVRKKLMSNKDFGGGTSKKAKNTWLSGKVKCKFCGSSLMYVGSPYASNYFRCRKRADSKSCSGPGTIRVSDVEGFVYNLMCQKMAEFQTLTGGNPTKANPKLTALNVELLQVEAEIEKLLDTLSGANPTLLSYANTKIEELDTKRQSLSKAIADVSAEAVSPEHIKRISGYLQDWDNISFEDRRLVVDGMISHIQATGENLQIAWKL
ncbi:MAG: recombinase family protein, partial [Oscillospiraceae bacterium]|nr:recombinase family protein [Oscillospiraceae bacterium]